MRYIVGVVRIFVGILFIISGFIKLNDPVGFSFKLEEYFSQGVLDLPVFVPYALTISIIVVILEVLLGVFLIVGFKVKFTLWSLLGMIVFFTFLTFYSAYFNKVTDCGCFGDAIKLTPWESFTKDVILLALILLLFFGKKYISPLFRPFLGKALIGLSLLFCLIYVNHVLNHLPVIDFRPYEIGKNIEDGMGVPEGAPKAIFEYEPPVHDFTIEQNGEDFAGQLLQEPKLLMIVAYDLRKSDLDAFKEVKRITDKALKNGYKVIGMSASGPDQTDALVADNNLGFQFYFTDETTLKTIVRSNPGALVLEKGTIEQKVHYNDLDELVFN